MSALNPVGNYVVTAKTLDVRDEAAVGGNILGSINEGDNIEVLDFDGKWCKIKFGDVEGWIVNGGIIDEKLVVYTIEYDFKGGKGEISSQHKQRGDTVNLSSEKLTKNGYEFAGWSLKKSAKTVDYARGAEYSADADMVLYAVWTPRAQKVTYYNYDGSVFEVIECKYNDWLVEPEAIPVKPDDEENSYVFAGWDKELDSIVYRNLEYTATFTAVPKPEESSTDEGAYDSGSSIGVSKVLLIGVAGVVALCAAGAVVAIIIVKNVKKKKEN